MATRSGTVHTLAAPVGGRSPAARAQRPARVSALTRHLLTGAELSSAEIHALIDRAIELKARPSQPQVLDGRSVALIFEKPSTRTRISFDTGVHELGGHPVVLRGDEMQLSRGESPRDTALVLSRHVSAICIRTGADAIIEELAEYASVPWSTCSRRATTPARPWRIS